MKIPDLWQEEIEVDALKIKCKPNSDRENFQMNTNPLAVFIGQENSANLGIPTVYNQASFDSLPLVEFTPSRNLMPKRVLELLRTDPPNEMMTANRKKEQKKSSEWEG